MSLPCNSELDISSYEELQNPYAHLFFEVSALVCTPNLRSLCIKYLI